MFRETIYFPYIISFKIFLKCFSWPQTGPLPQEPLTLFRSPRVICNDKGFTFFTRVSCSHVGQYELTLNRNLDLDFFTKDSLPTLTFYLSHVLLLLVGVRLTRVDDPEDRRTLFTNLTGPLPSLPGYPTYWSLQLVFRVLLRIKSIHWSLLSCFKMISQGDSDVKLIRKSEDDNNQPWGEIDHPNLGGCVQLVKRVVPSVGVLHTVNRVRRSSGMSEIPW